MNPETGRHSADAEVSENKKLERQTETALGGFVDMSEFDMPELDAEVAIDTIGHECQSFLNKEEADLDECLREYGLSKDELVASHDYYSIVDQLAKNEETIRLLYRESKNKIKTLLEQTEQQTARVERETGTPGDYQKLAEVVLKGLEDKERSGDLEVGPVYHVKNQAGQSIDVDTFSYSVAYFDEFTKKYVCIARDAHGDVLALRAATLEINAHGKSMLEPYMMTGHIATAKRQAGVATMLDTAFSYLVQQESNTFLNPIEWKVKNQNLIDLEVLESDYQKNPTPELAASIEKKKQEQERWQALYGEGGRFDFKPTDDPKEFKKTVTASRIARLERGEVSDVYLEPDPENLSVILPRTVLAENVEGLKVQRAAEIKSAIQKIKESLNK